MSTINIPRESTMQEIAQALNLIAISVTGQTPEISNAGICTAHSSEWIWEKSISCRVAIEGAA